MIIRIALQLITVFVLIVGHAQASSEIVNKRVIVAATNDEWTPAGIKVAKGDILIVLERGNQIRVGPFIGHVDANGATSGGEGALHIKTGVSAGEKIGARGMLIVEEPGAVKFKVKDSKYDDNEGKFVVNVIHIPGAMIPPTQLADFE